MIDWLISYWNPAATIIATCVSMSVLGFQIYKYYDEKGRLTDIDITDSFISSDGKTEFVLNCKNKGNEDIYITDVYCVFPDKKVNYMNSTGNEGTLYNNEFDKPLKLNEREPINDLHYSTGSLDTDKSEIEGCVYVETTNKTHIINVLFKKKA